MLYELARSSDVFLTNFLPDARDAAAHRRRRHPRRQPRHHLRARQRVRRRGVHESTRGGYDATAYWARGGHAAGVQPPDYDGVLGMPGPAYGDSIGGMTIAGGIAAALLARERTGEPSVLDVSLLGVGLWANALVGRHLARERRAVAGRLDGQPARGAHQPRGGAGADVRRPLPLPRHDPGVEVLGRLLPPPRPRGHDRRRALEHPREAARQRTGGGRRSCTR